MKKLLVLLIPLGGVALFLVGAAAGDASSNDPRAALAPTTQLSGGTPLDVSTPPGATALPAPSSFERVDGVATATDAAPTPPADLTKQPPVLPIAAPAPADASASTSDATAPSTAPVTISSDALAVLGLHPIDDLPARFRFIDPCASAGAPRDGCGDGVGATVLAIDSSDPLDPLRFDNGLHPVPIPTTLARCPVNGTTPDGQVRITFMTNNPAHLDLHLVSHGGTTVDQHSSMDASDSERDRWTDHRLAHDDIRENGPTAVQYCLDFTGLTPGSGYDLTIHGVDDAGATRDATYPLTVLPVTGTTGSGRPPTMFSPQDDHHGKVIASLAEGEYFYFAELPRNTDDRTDATCTSVEQQVLTGHYNGSYRLFGSSMAPITGLFAADYPYDQRYQDAVAADFWPDEGEIAALCTWIAKPAARSFDLPVVQDRTELDIEAPRYHRYRVTVFGGHLDQSVAAGAVTLQLEENGYHSPGITLPATDAAPGDLRIDPAVVGDSLGSWHPDTTTLDVTSPNGTLATVLNTPRSGSAPGIQLLDVQIKGPRHGSGLCGSSFGGCDPPTTDTFLGTLHVAVVQYDGPGGAPTDAPGAPSWQETPVEFIAPAAPGLAPHVQIDETGFSATTRGGSDGSRPTMDVRFTTDRPSTATVHAYGWSAGDACGGEEQTEAAPATTHAFHWSNLCFGRGYQIVIALTEADGHVSTWDVGGTSGPPLGYAVAPQLPASTITVAVGVTSHTSLALLGQRITVDGITIGGRDDPHADRRCRDFAQPAPDVAHGSTTNNEGGYPITLGEPLYVRIETDLATPDAGGDCYDDSRHTFEGYVSLADVVSGTPVTFTGDDPTLSVTVVLTAVVPRPISPSP